MENFLIEYIRKGLVEIDENGRKKVIPTKGEKKGVLFCEVNPDRKSVSVGFSLCCNKDRFDHIDGKRQKGFGLELAECRAVKWEKRKYVKIPDSIYNNFEKFINRCKKYYKNKEFPKWTETTQLTFQKDK